MSDPRFLITTAYEKTWKYDQPILFLGAWCRRYDRQDVWRNMDAIVAEPFGGSQAQHDVDAQGASALEMRLLDRLVPLLNDFHDRVQSQRYWRIILGQWLHRFTIVGYNRFHTLRQCLERYEISGTVSIAPEKYTLTVTDSLSFVHACNDAVWNSVLWSRMLEMNPKFGLIPQKIGCYGSTQFGALEHVTDSITLAHRARQIWEQASKVFSRRSEVFILNSYLPKALDFKLHLRLRQFPQLWSGARPAINTDTDLAARARLAANMSDASDDEITTTLIKLLWEIMPHSYLEAFGFIEDAAQKLGWPEQPKTIFTSNSFDFDEFFKIWTANQTTHGSHYVVGQHGNNYGTHRYENPCIEEIVADRFVTWGWGAKSGNHRQGFILKKPYPSVSTHCIDGGLLLIELHPAHQISLYDEVVDFEGYFTEQTQFVAALPHSIRQDLTVRLHIGSKSLHENENARWTKFDPQIRIDNFELPLPKLIAESRLVVHSYDSTGLLETLSQNIPTLAFWSNEYAHLRDEAVPFYELLRKAGIIHFSADSAAMKVREVYDDINVWWASPEIQTARSAFCAQYAKVATEPVRLLHEVLND